MIDWESGETHLLLNPRMPADDRARLESLAATAPDLPAHVWLATSGTSGALKLTALSKEALLVSAAAVNRRLDAASNDVWCAVLPTFHVGGLGIHARAYLSGARVVAAAWDAESFVDICRDQEITLTSLVPAQVSDLVRAGLRAPQALRAAVVGGGAVPPVLYAAAKELGWPVLPSYGMTECCSQVATARSASPDLVLLDHVSARTNEEGLLELRSSALLTGYAIDGQGFVDPKVDGWFRTGDVGEVDGERLRVSGRRGDFVKIGGESVDLSRLDRILAAIADPARAAVVALPDGRLGHVIALAHVGDGGERVAELFNERVQPFERIRSVQRVASIPRSPLGKLLRVALRDAFP